MCGGDRERKHPRTSAKMDFLNKPRLTGELKEVPGLGEVGIRTLNRSGIFTTYQLIGKSLDNLSIIISTIMSTRRSMPKFSRAALASSPLNSLKPSSLILPIICSTLDEVASLSKVAPNSPSNRWRVAADSEVEEREVEPPGLPKAGSETTGRLAEYGRPLRTLDISVPCACGVGTCPPGTRRNNHGIWLRIDSSASSTEIMGTHDGIEVGACSGSTGAPTTGPSNHGTPTTGPSTTCGSWGGAEGVVMGTPTGSAVTTG